MAILMNSSFCVFTISLLRNCSVKYYGLYCKVVQWYSMRWVCIAGYFLKFSFKVGDETNGGIGSKLETSNTNLRLDGGVT